MGQDTRLTPEELYRYLVREVDAALRTTVRDPADPPTDGAIAVLAVFQTLDRLGIKHTGLKL